MKTTTRGATALMAALALAACSDSATTAPELTEAGTLNADVAMVASQTTLDDLADMSVDGGIPPGVDGVGDPAAMGPGHGQGQGRFAGTRGGEVDREHTVTFLDADGIEMDAYDDLLTATILHTMDVSVVREGVRWDATMERHRDMEVTGLLGEETERTFNGSGTDDVSRTRFDDETGDRSYEMSGTVTISDVVMGVPRSEHPWPLSGTITRHVSVTVVNGPNGDVSFERTVVITFDGTQYATLEVDGETFTIDLADREGSRPQHGRNHRGG